MSSLGSGSSSAKDTVPKAPSPVKATTEEGSPPPQGPTEAEGFAPLSALDTVSWGGTLAGLSRDSPEEEVDFLDQAVQSPVSAAATTGRDDRRRTFLPRPQGGQGPDIGQSVTGIDTSIEGLLKLAGIATQEKLTYVTKGLGLNDN